jgi:hypothetical protein
MRSHNHRIRKRNLNGLGMREVRLLLELLLQERVRLSLLGSHGTGLKRNIIAEVKKYDL